MIGDFGPYLNSSFDKLTLESVDNFFNKTNYFLLFLLKKSVGDEFENDLKQAIASKKFVVSIKMVVRQFWFLFT